MIVITDSNIFFSALISPEGVVAKILSEKKRIQYLVPEYLLGEDSFYERYFRRE